MNLYKILEIPVVYNFVQFLFGSAEFSQMVRSELASFADGRVLELGSGTGAFTQVTFPGLIASDVNQAYLSEIDLPEDRKMVLSADHLENLPEKFDLIYSVGLFHHLTDEQVEMSIQQSLRKLTSRGKLLIIDNVWPTRLRPVAYLVRRLDRGRNVRSMDQLNCLLGKHSRVTLWRSGKYSWCNLEYVVIECANDESN